MDTSPQPKESRLDQLTTLLNETLKQMVIEITNNKAQPELADTIEQVLTQANWFYDMVKETINDNHDIESLVDDRVDDRVGSAVDEWFSYNFTLTDHCDIDDIVGDALDDKLESIVEEKLEELLEEKLKNATVNIRF
jgi:predicted house-cleaning noncanonical NTP pyrophosphatase (MazG superfamily)